jgi:hypothetical protein
MNLSSKNLDLVKSWTFRFWLHHLLNYICRSKHFSCCSWQPQHWEHLNDAASTQKSILYTSLDCRDLQNGHMIWTTEYKIFNQNVWIPIPKAKAKEWPHRARNNVIKYTISPFLWLKWYILLGCSFIWSIPLGPIPSIPPLSQSYSLFWPVTQNSQLPVAYFTKDKINTMDHYDDMAMRKIYVSVW